ncbi:hypothetical protein B0H16DRAFT_1739449 [Mycena metata]|uniref:Nuclear pore complex protein n=1 Tax=Mycena metata TaxID=1033252 RepID=A0AAD7MIR1_9AGAR|nr:hypothetical protein B0H16DRAFT_1739449 [Mycena metata]
MNDNLEGLLHPVTGFAPRLRQICQNQLAKYLENVYPIMHAFPLLLELVAVREWLQDTAPPAQHPEATGYWKFTKHGVMQSLRIGSGGARDGLVKEMDPDAVNRGDGCMLAADDTVGAQALYSRTSPASLRGCLLFQWRAISVTFHNAFAANEQYEDGAMEEDLSYAWEGNRRRQLWKSTCTRAAINPNVSGHDRILYSTLVPTPQTSIVLKTACRTWENHLWAQISVVVEENFWDGGLAAVETVVEEEEAESEEWEKEVVGSFEILKTVATQEGSYWSRTFVLEAAGQRDLIAMYAGSLGDNAVEHYALFLVSLELSADITERRLALIRARDHGLDMDRVAIVAAERTMAKALDAPPSNAELFLLRSIEWTTFTEATYDTALHSSRPTLFCDISAINVGSGRVQVAQRLLVMLPFELVSIGEPEERATEYLHYRRSYDQITKLLASEWLLSNDLLIRRLSRRSPPPRAHPLRQIYVPELIIRLHFLLFASRTQFPENLKRALKLANVVADSRYKLYEDFVNEDGRRLGDYLGAVRQAILGGGSDPFRIISS